MIEENIVEISHNLEQADKYMREERHEALIQEIYCLTIWNFKKVLENYRKKKHWVLEDAIMQCLQNSKGK